MSASQTARESMSRRPETRAEPTSPETRAPTARIPSARPGRGLVRVIAVSLRRTERSPHRLFRYACEATAEWTPA